MHEEGLIFDIQRHSLHDGPGIRTLVFLKGCPLHCLWCCNPESQDFGPELLFHPDQCIGCLKCARVCPHGASRVREGKINFERIACRGCGSCANICYAEARVMKGRRMSVEGTLREVLRDQPFYTRSGGGMTLGGGEPLYQSRFAAALLATCKNKGIHTAVETAGHSPWPDLERLLAYTDLFLYDLKHVDAEKHRRFTGVDLSIILDNLERLGRKGQPIIVRTPIIPGFNDTPREMEAIARKAADGGIREMHLLPYHRFGAGKYGLLGRSYPFQGREEPGRELLETLRETVGRQGMIVRIGG